MEKSSPDELRVAREAFDAWRTARPRGSRIPEELWARAVELADKYGFATTSYRLRLNPEQFRRRFDAARHDRASSRNEAGTQSSFVEVRTADLVSASRSRPRVQTDVPRPADVITARIERAGGASLSLDLPADAAHVGSLLAAFLQR